MAASAFVIGAGWGFFMLWRRGPRRALLAPAILVTTQALWFVVPTALSWAAGIGVPQTRYSSGILAVMHAFQYSLITQHFARREQGAAWSAGRYWLAIVAGGMALFVPIPWLASYVGHVDFTASMLIVASVVNLQHFMLDGVVWKLRDKRVSQALIESAPSAPAAPATFAGPRPPCRLITATALAVLIALVGLDQWRYRLASRQSDAAALEEALRLNPFSHRAEARLLQALVSSGPERGRADPPRRAPRQPARRRRRPRERGGARSAHQPHGRRRAVLGARAAGGILNLRTSSCTRGYSCWSRTGRPKPSRTTAAIWNWSWRNTPGSSPIPSRWCRPCCDSAMRSRASARQRRRGRNMTSPSGCPGRPGCASSSPPPASGWLSSPLSYR